MFFSRANPYILIFLGYFYFPLNFSKSSVITPSTLSEIDSFWIIDSPDIKFLVRCPLFAYKIFIQGWVFMVYSVAFVLERQNCRHDEINWQFGIILSYFSTTW